MRLSKPYSFLDGINIQLESEEIPDHPTFSFADVVQQRLDIINARPQGMQKLRYIVEQAKLHVEKEDVDWVFIICGVEGTGKSNLGINLALMLDPSFEMKTQMVNSWNEDHSYLDFLEKYKSIKYKAVVFDEAVTIVGAKKHAARENIAMIEMYNMNRQLNHFHIFTLPNYWGIDKDLRERRVRSVLYVFADPDTRKRFYAYYSKEKVSKLITSGENYKGIFSSPRKFLKQVIPDFVEAFPKMPENYRKYYLKRKTGGFNEFFNDQRGIAKLSQKKKHLDKLRIIRDVKLLGDDIDETDI